MSTEAVVETETQAAETQTEDGSAFLDELDGLLDTEAESPDDSPEPEQRADEATDRVETEAGGEADETEADDSDPIRSIDPAYLAAVISSGMSMDEARKLAKDDPEYLIGYAQSLPQPAPEKPAKKAEDANKPSWGESMVEQAMSSIGDDFDEEQKDSIRKGFEAIAKGVDERFGKSDTKEATQQAIAHRTNLINQFDAQLKGVDPDGKRYGQGSSLDGSVPKRTLEKRNQLYTVAAGLQKNYHDLNLRITTAQAIQMAHAAINHDSIKESAKAETRAEIKQTAKRRDRAASSPSSQTFNKQPEEGSDAAILAELQTILPG